MGGASDPPAPLRECTGAHCTQQVFFARIRRKADGGQGKPQPFDWPPTDAGRYAEVGTADDGAPLLAQTGDFAGPGYMPHHATCPDVAAFRR